MHPTMIQERVRQILAHQLGRPLETIQPISDLAAELGVDSLDMVDLMMAFEEAFGIEIPDEAAERTRTVQEAVDFIASQLSA